MSNIISAKKRARQSAKKRIANMSLRSRARTYVKKLLILIKEGKKQEANEYFRQTTSVLDKMVSKGLYHKNKSSRYKKRLNKKIKELS